MVHWFSKFALIMILLQVLHKHGDKLYSGLREAIEDHLKNNVRHYLFFGIVDK